MKKLIGFAMVFVLIVGMLLINASAAGTTKTLLASSADKYVKIDASYGGETGTINIEIKDGKHIFAGDKIWPAACHDFADNEITVPIEDTVLNYSFTVDAGKANIILFFDGDISSVNTGKDFVMTKMIDEQFRPNDAGVPDDTFDDVIPGTYTGSFKLSDMIANTHFPDSVDTSEGTITFTALKVFSVSGAIVTIEKFELVTGGGDGDENSSESEEASSAASTDSTASSEAASSAAASSAAASSTASSAASQPGTGDNAVGVAIFAIIAIFAVSGGLVVSRRKR